MEKSITPFISLLVMLIIGVSVVLVTIINVTTQATNLYVATNDNLGTLTTTPKTMYADHSTIRSGSETLRLVNTSGGTSTSIALTKNGNYSVSNNDYDAGRFNLGTPYYLEANTAGNYTIYANYTYSLGYIENSSGRTVIALLPLLFVVVIILLVIGFATGQGSSFGK